jgi:hypothetical protein
MAHHRIYGRRISILHRAVPKRHSPSYAGGTGQGIGIVERKEPLQNGDEEVGKPFIDEKG